MNKTYIEEMLFALKANIEYLRQRGSLVMTVQNGTLIENRSNFYIYEFQLDHLREIEPDTEIEVRFKEENISGKIEAIFDSTIQIGLEKYIGVNVSEAKLIISSYYLLEILCEKLEKVAKGEIKLTDLAEKTFGLKSFKIEKADYTIPLSQYSLPNSSQQKAIKLALGSEVSFIWGPPGTGKTETIARIIEGFLSQDLSVLLIAHTNIAVDGVLEKVVKYLEYTDDYKEGRFLREGLIQKEELKKYKVTPKAILEEKVAPIKKEIELIKSKIDQIQAKIERSKEILNKYKELNNFRQEEKKLLDFILEKEKDFAKSKDELKFLKRRLNEIEEKIKECQTMGVIKRFFLGLNLKELVKQKTMILVNKDKELKKIDEISKLITSIKEKLSEVKEKRSEVEVRLGKEDVHHHEVIVEKGQEEIKKLNEEKDLLAKQLEELPADLIKNAKVIATTLTKSYSSKAILERDYDCLILDEASMAPLPALWYAAGLAKKKVVIVGDFYQLPPIAKHNILNRSDKTEEEIEKERYVTEKWLKKDIFEISGTVSSIKSKNWPAWMAQLKYQYRMHPDIADIVNTLIYTKEGEQFALISADNTKNNGKSRLEKEPLKNSHVGIYDTSCYGHFLSNRNDSGSYYNFYQAIIAVELAKKAIESGYESIGITSPFRAQTKLIQNILEDEGLYDKKMIEINTVHRFQGGEKQIIIFETTTAHPSKLTTDERLINVAFSRAKEKLIVVGNVDRIIKEQTSDLPLRKFVDYCKEKQIPILSAEDLVAKYTINDKADLWLKEKYSLGLHEKELKEIRIEFLDKERIDEVLEKDLLYAKKEVIICSPFINIKKNYRLRLNRFLEIFKHLISKNLKIFVITRPANEYTKDLKESDINRIVKIFEEFEEMGIIVLPFKGYIHEKYALVDRKIQWHGSLNILAHSGSESMLRLDGKNSCEYIMKLLNLDKNIGPIGENRLRRCEYCNSPGAWYWTNRIYSGKLLTNCLVCGRKFNQKKDNFDDVFTIKDQIPVCPEHGKEMIIRRGRYGDFWGCPMYPDCKKIVKLSS